MTASTDQERVSLPLDLVNDLLALCTPEDHELRERVKQAARRTQVVPVPLSDELPKGFISDVLTAAGLVRHGKQCKSLADRLGDAIEKIWAVSIAQRETLAAHNIKPTP